MAEKIAKTCQKRGDFGPKVDIVSVLGVQWILKIQVCGVPNQF